ncbi:MAG: hypothetical protein OER21_12840 [Gemmatimonadota bacterium]|nr:hypothetical protein [Gemmatimonadota bacterium]
MAAAQQFRAAGRIVVAGTPDSVPPSGAWAVLHEVRMQGGGAIDSVRLDARGRYRMRVAVPDTSALYLVSTTYRGITYFSSAMTARRAPDSVPTLVVYDTSSVAPPIGVAQRHVVVRGGGSGRRSVLELLVLANAGQQTRIAGDDVRPVWVGRLPSRLADFEVGESDVSAEAVARVGDSLVVTAPVPPGQKQLVFTYTLPAGPDLVLPVDQAVGRLLVLLEDTAATLVEGPLQRRGVEVFEDAQFALFDGPVPAAGGQVVFRFSRPGLPAGVMVAIVVGVVALVLLLAVPLLRRPPAAVVVPPGDATPALPREIARAIARLDAEFEAQSDRTPDAESVYRERRQALKARLAAALAARESQP